MSPKSRISGFYRLPLTERRRKVADFCGIDFDELSRGLEAGGIDPCAADKIVENVIGTYGLPFGVALNACMNGRDRLIPMVVEEPSVIAATSNAARIVRAAGGFQAEVEESLMTAQVQVTEVPDAHAARAALERESTQLLAKASTAVPGLVRRGGGPRSIDVRDLGGGLLVAHVYIDCRDAMGANLVNTVAEAIGPDIARLLGGRLGLRILSNLCDRRRVRVRCWAEASDLAVRGTSQDDRRAPDADRLRQAGDSVIDGVVAASIFAERDPYRATTHNKGIMNGVDSVVVATGNDYRAVEAGAHAFAARSGTYRPLATWTRDGDRLRGELIMPLALGTVGGTLRVHPTARLALALAQVTSADDLAMLAGSAGLASNLSALRALATEGIQRGHMSLHARSVATAAGAEPEEVDGVAVALSESGSIDIESARKVLMALRNDAERQPGD